MEPDANSASAASTSLDDILHDSLEKCPLSQNRFLPLRILHDVITVESVRANLHSVVGIQTTSSHNHLAVAVVHQAKAVFASLVYVGRQDAIRDLLSEGITDEDLPLSRKGSGDDRNLLCSRNGSRTFKTFLNWKRANIDHFLREQWRVQALVFDTTGSQFTLDLECALPLRPECEQIGVTGFSKVYRCALYSTHYQSDYQLKRQKTGHLQVAIKELHEQKSFDHEKDILTRIQELNNRHLIKHIATCQIGSKYYVIFPLANGGNLLQYWERENDTPRSPELILWSFQQLLGLTGAIRTLHHDLAGNKNCRHGDIKPANILLFNEEGSDLLVLADLQATSMRRSGTETMETSRMYEAPEVLESARQGQPRARTYDIWSLGCVFLEFAIWVLYDYTAIKNFEAHRLRPLENPYASFYRINSGKAEILSEVSDAIDALREDPRCKGGTALKSLVNLTADKLLVTSVESRYKADELHRELQKVVEDVEQFPSHLLNSIIQPPPVPRVFLPIRHASKTL